MLVRVVGKGQRFLSLPESKHRQLFHELIALPQRSFSSQGRLKPQLDRIMSLCELENDPLRFHKLTSSILHLLLEVIDLGRQAQAGQVSGPIQRAQDYVRQHLEEPQSVAQLADVARLSPVHFRSRFRKETGLTPSEFVVREKIEEAKKRLTHPDQTVTAVAFDLGFSTSQYFATVFRHYTGVSPSRFRQLRTV
jgi:AraC-like DNA-binding protein